MAVTNDATVASLKKPKINSLSGLKVIAMFFLFWQHGPIPSPSGCDLGARTCEFFFVCSGFLVAYNYYGKNTPFTWSQSIKYSTGKLANMWPLHFIAFIIVCLAIPLHTLLSKKMALTAVLNLALVQAWSPNTDVFFSFNGASWFLSALLFCYFMSPFFLKFSKHIKQSLILFIFVFIFRFMLEWIPGISPITVWDVNVHVSPIIRSLEFFMGLLMCPLFIYVQQKISQFKEDKKRSGILIAVFTVVEIAVLGLTVLLAIKKNQSWLRAEFVALFCLVVFVFSFDGGLCSKFLGSKPFLFLSSIQFEFYILHQAIIKSLGYPVALLLKSWQFESIVLGAIILILAWLYNRFLSKKMSLIMKKIFNFLFKSFDLDITV